MGIQYYGDNDDDKEPFFTSEVVLHTSGPTQTVAKCIPYRWNIQHLFVLKGANKMHYILFMTLTGTIYLLYIL